MKIGVVGGGVVGHATARAFIEHVDEVRVYDIVKEKATHSLSEVLECDLTFVCLSTPQSKEGLECDTFLLLNFFNIIRSYKPYYKHNLVLRSTVPIGFTKRIQEDYQLPNLVHSPEFLTARCAVTDAQLPARNIIGYPGWNFKSGCDATSYLEDFNQPEEQCFRNLILLYQKRFPSVPVHCMTSDESEAVKLFQNSFFAVKVAYWNECNQLAEKLGLDWQVVMNAILADGRISPSHTKVPGPDGRYGYGGTCLPKDIASLFSQMSQRGVDGNGWSVTGSALKRNIEDRKRS